jgi:hypothetical protein
MFALRTKTAIKPMFENELETFSSDIGSQTIVVRRANTRFAPTLVLDIGWISITTIYPQDIPFAWDISENNFPIIDIVRFERNVNWVRVKLSLHYLT